MAIAIKNRDQCVSLAEVLLAVSLGGIEWPPGAIPSVPVSKATVPVGGTWHGKHGWRSRHLMNVCVGIDRVKKTEFSDGSLLAPRSSGVCSSLPSLILFR